MAVQLARERDEAFRCLRSAQGYQFIAWGFETGTILENATRICEAKFGILFSYDGNRFQAAAHRTSVIS
jgi:hypothetical protein